MSKLVELKAIESGKLKPLNFLVIEGEITAVVGPAGSGKTDLIRLIGGLSQASSGEIDITAEKAMIFRGGALLPWLTLAQNIETVLSGTGLLGSQARRRARLSLDALKLAPRAKAYPDEVNLSDKVLAGFARAMAKEPSLIVGDQPFDGLDVLDQEKVHTLVSDQLLAGHRAMIFSTSSIEEAVNLADQVVLLHQGRVARTYHLADMERPRRLDKQKFIDQVEIIRRDFLGLGV